MPSLKCLLCFFFNFKHTVCAWLSFSLLILFLCYYCSYYLLLCTTKNGYQACILNGTWNEISGSYISENECDCLQDLPPCSLVEPDRPLTASVSRCALTARCNSPEDCHLRYLGYLLKGTEDRPLASLTQSLLTFSGTDNYKHPLLR
jgi:hypothetical protein